MAVSVPVNVSVPVPEPTTFTPPPVVAVSDPEATDSVTVMVPLPASASAIDKPVRPSVPSSPIVKVPGSVLTGASLTALTVIVLVSLSVSVPPLPLLPPSLVVMVSWTVPLKSATGV